MWKLGSYSAGATLLLNFLLLDNNFATYASILSHEPVGPFSVPTVPIVDRTRACGYTVRVCCTRAQRLWVSCDGSLIMIVVGGRKSGSRRGRRRW